VHQWNVRYINLTKFLYSVTTASIIYGPLVALLKTAILLDWLHLFNMRHTRTAMAWTIYVMIALNCAYYTAASLAIMFACTPRKRFWDPTTPGTCTSTHATAVTHGVVNMVSDFIMMAIPQKVIWSLHLNRGQKYGISSLFAIGIL
jgi:hypothetical protein